jgi:uncharacterized protein YqgQ
MYVDSENNDYDWVTRFRKCYGICVYIDYRRDTVEGVQTLQ